MGFFQQVQNAWNQATSTAQDVTNMATSHQERKISIDEYTMANQKVFNFTLPALSRINIGNDSGLGDRPYTTPHPLRPLEYLIHAGPDACPNLTVLGCRNSDRRAVYIHNNIQGLQP